MTTDLYTPRAGDIGLVAINGEVGRLIRLGQWLNGSGSEPFEHAFVVTDEKDSYGRPMIVQAEPGGAQFVALPDYTTPVHWCLGIAYGLNDVHRALISQAAIECIGVPYSALDYFSLAAKRLHIPGGPLLTDYVKSTHHMICSQLAAWTYYSTGHAIWPGQTFTGNDTPGDLYQKDMLLRAQYARGV